MEISTNVRTKNLTFLKTRLRSVNKRRIPTIEGRELKSKITGNAKCRKLDEDEKQRETITWKGWMTLFSLSQATASESMTAEVTPSFTQAGNLHKNKKKDKINSKHSNTSRVAVPDPHKSSLI
jgi:hypothetical protein